MVNLDSPDTGERDEHLDGCTCDSGGDHDATADDLLPAAAGGIRMAAHDRGDEEDVDGCDVDFDGPDTTADDELQAATGGVAP